MSEQNNSHDMRWRRFPEEKPEKDGRYEIVLEGFSIPFTAIVRWSTDRNEFRDGQGPIDVTHWRGGPLP